MKNRTKKYTIHKGGNSNLFEKIRCSSIKRTLKRFNKLNLMCSDEINEFIADYIMNQQNTKSRVTSINKILTRHPRKLRISTNIDYDMKKCIQFIEQISKNDEQLNQFIKMLGDENFIIANYIMNQQNTNSITSINEILTNHQSKLRISTNIDDDMGKCIEFIEQISENEEQLNQFIEMLSQKNFKLYKYKHIYKEEEEEEEENENEDYPFPLPTDISPLSSHRLK